MHSGPVRLDEPHPAHVAGEVVDVRDAADGLPARLERAEVGDAVVDPGKHLVPLVERLDVDGAKVREALLLQVADEPTADESAGAGDEDRIVRGDRLRPSSSLLVPV